jgi:hypothetical protein
VRRTSHWYFLTVPALLWSVAVCTPERRFSDPGDGDGDNSSLGGETGGHSTSTGGDGEDTGGNPSDGSGGQEGSSGGAPTGGNGSGGNGSGGEVEPSSLADELVLHLKMEEDMNSTTASDSSGSGNHATVINGGVSFVDGFIGKAARFDGSGWLEVADDPSLDNVSALTMAAWVQFSYTTGGYSHGVFSKRQGFGTNTAYALFLLNEGDVDRLYVDIDDEDVPNRFQSLTEFDLDEWHHVVAVFDGSRAANERVRLYIDGTLDREGFEEDTQIGRHSASALLIGNLPNGGEVMRGLIDELALWRRALSPDEVAWLATHEF